MATFPTTLQLTGSPHIGGMGPDPLENPITRASRAAQPGATRQEQERAANDLEAATPSLSPMAQPHAANLVRALRTNVAKLPKFEEEEEEEEFSPAQLGAQNKVFSRLGITSPQALPVPGRFVDLERKPGTEDLAGPARVDQFRPPTGAVGPGEVFRGGIVTSDGAIARGLIEKAPVISNRVGLVSQLGARDILELRRDGGLDIATINAMNKTLSAKGASITNPFPKEVNAALLAGGDNPADIVRGLASEDPRLRTAAQGQLKGAQQAVASQIEMTARRKAIAEMKVKATTPISDLPTNTRIGQSTFFDKKIAHETGALVALDLSTSKSVALKMGIPLKDKDITFVRGINGALDKVDEIREVGKRLFTSNDPDVLAWRAGKLSFQKVAQTNPDAALWLGQGAFMFAFARAFGNDARISDKDAELAAQTAFLGILQTRDVFLAGMERLERIFKNGAKRTMSLPTIPVPKYKFGTRMDAEGKNRYLRALGWKPEDEDNIPPPPPGFEARIP